MHPSVYMRPAGKLALIVFVAGAIARDRAPAMVTLEPIKRQIVQSPAADQVTLATPAPKVVPVVPVRNRLDPLLKVATELKRTWRTKHVDDCSEQEKLAALHGGAKRQALMLTSAHSYRRANCIQCSDYVLVVLRRMGLDLDRPVQGTFGYDEARGVRTVTRYMMAGLQPEATLAVVKQLRGGRRDTSLLRSYKWHEFQPGDRFGAGAALVDAGGQQVELVDARPGDVQQTIGAPSSGRRKAHAGIVWETKGCGTVWNGHAQSPITSLNAPQGPGWLSIPCDDDTQFALIDPHTAPELVGDFETHQVRLLDANHTRGQQGIRVSNVYRELPQDTVVHLGRARSSRWFQDLDGAAMLDEQPAP